MAGRITPIKKRSQTTYQRKVNRVIEWYNRLLELRKNPVEGNKDKEHTDKQPRKRKDLKPLDFYIDKIRKASN
jgi:hypothetical protein